MRHAADELVAADADHHEPGDQHEPASRGPGEDAARGLLRVAGRAARAGARQEPDGEGAEAGVDDPAPERTEPVEAAVGAFGAVAEGRAEEPPEGIAAEADGDSASRKCPNGCCSTVFIAPCWFVILPPWPVARSNARIPMIG